MTRDFHQGPRAERLLMDSMGRSSLRRHHQDRPRKRLPRERAPICTQSGRRKHAGRLQTGDKDDGRICFCVDVDGKPKRAADSERLLRWTFIWPEFPVAAIVAPLAHAIELGRATSIDRSKQIQRLFWPSCHGQVHRGSRRYTTRHPTGPRGCDCVPCRSI